VDFIQFEFGEAAIDARSYLRDLFRLLPEYTFSRVLKDGLRSVPEYREELEIFRTINFLAERTGPRRQLAEEWSVEGAPEDHP
jgi:hypothetical protein